GGGAARVPKSSSASDLAREDGSALAIITGFCGVAGGVKASCFAGACARLDSAGGPASASGLLIGRPKPSTSVRPGTLTEEGSDDDAGGSEGVIDPSRPTTTVCTRRVPSESETEPVVVALPLSPRRPITLLSV